MAHGGARPRIDRDAQRPRTRPVVERGIDARGEITLGGDELPDLIRRTRVEAAHFRCHQPLFCGAADDIEVRLEQVTQRSRCLDLDAEGDLVRAGRGTRKQRQDHGDPCQGTAQRGSASQRPRRVRGTKDAVKQRSREWRGCETESERLQRSQRILATERVTASSDYMSLAGNRPGEHRRILEGRRMARPTRPVLSSRSAGDAAPSGDSALRPRSSIRPKSSCGATARRADPGPDSDRASPSRPGNAS